MKNYSQSTEQPVILNYFKGFKGTFCDIGANDGITFSNTYALALNGWNGVLVEASPKAAQRIKTPHEGIEVFGVALGSEKKQMVLQESGALIGKEDVALVSTFHQHEMQRFNKVVEYNPVIVQCITWKELLFWANIDTFDFISMDIEGSELEVLPQMDLSEVKMFCIEWNSKPELKREYEKYFDGFKLIHTTAENLIYAR
jgi:FkbM family methyltransferase